MMQGSDRISCAAFGRGNISYEKCKFCCRLEDYYLVSVLEIYLLVNIKKQHSPMRRVEAFSRPTVFCRLLSTGPQNVTSADIVPFAHVNAIHVAIIRT